MHANSKKNNNNNTSHSVPEDDDCAMTEIEPHSAPAAASKSWPRDIVVLIIISFLVNCCMHSTEWVARKCESERKEELRAAILKCSCINSRRALWQLLYRNVYHHEIRYLEKKTNSTNLFLNRSYGIFSIIDWQTRYYDAVGKKYTGLVSPNIWTQESSFSVNDTSVTRRWLTYYDLIHFTLIKISSTILPLHNLKLNHFMSFNYWWIFNWDQNTNFNLKPCYFAI